MDQATTKPFALFKSSLFTLSTWKSDLEPVPGKDLATYLASELAKKGASFPLRCDPEVDGNSWSLFVQWKETSYSLFLWSVPYKEPPEDWWLLMPYLSKGGCLTVILPGVFKRTTSDAELLPLSQAIREILEKGQVASQIEWIDSQEYDALWEKWWGFRKPHSDGKNRRAPRRHPQRDS